MTARVFIDGSAGTTGLRIRERLSQRRDVELLAIPDELRKDAAARADRMNAADVVFLCLPDAAAREAVELVSSERTVVIDTSTAHRTAPGWTYGFPEIVGHEAVAASRRIANPGCHASGFIALAAPLVRAGIIRPDAQLHCTSLTGYSGGGKQMIAQYEAGGRDGLLEAPRLYGLGQEHKHLPEMAALCGLQALPTFCPIVAPYYAGMEAIVPLTPNDVAGPMPTADELLAAYEAFYANAGRARGAGASRIVRVARDADEGGFLSAGAFAGYDDMQVTVCGGGDRILLAARFDNLGKGASGSAVQNMNIVLGTDEEEGLVLHGSV